MVRGRAGAITTTETAYRMIEMVPEAQIDELIRLADLQGIDPYAVPG